MRALKILAYCALHYGAEWLEWAIRSVEPLIDEFHIFYTDHPSHGTSTSRSKPAGEDRHTLHSIATAFDIVRWHDVSQFYLEGGHRDHCVKYLTALDADLILWVDADEVWDLDVLSDAIDFVMDNDAYEYRVHAMHFWRSVNWVCMDECMPVRLIKPGGKGVGYVPGRGFYHFGYAQSHMLVNYKMAIHGHRAELRRNWWGNVYAHWEPGKVHKCGVHPTNECDDKTGKPFWTPIPFCRFDIEHLIGDHPYFTDELV